MKKRILQIAMLTTLIFSACSSNDDDDLCADIVGDEYIEIAENLLTSSISFGTNPTNENCNNYKNAMQNYIDYAESIKNCLDSAERAELQEEITELETELANLNCN